MPSFSKKKNELHHIYFNGEKNAYRVIFNRTGFQHYSSHKLLEDAIKKRDEIVEELVNLVRSQCKMINTEYRIRSRENTKNTPDDL